MPIVSLLMVTQTIGWGTSLSFLGVLALPVAIDLNIPVALAYAGGSLFYGVGALTAGATGRLCDRFGSFAVLAGGSLLFIVALLTLASAQHVAQYLLGWCVFGAGMNAALATASYSALVQSDFEHANRDIGYLTLATGLSSSLFWPISSLLIAHMGWRDTCLVYALVNLIIPFAIHLALARRAAANHDHKLQGENEAGENDLAASAREPLRWLKLAMICSGFFTSAMGLMIIGLFVALGGDYTMALTAASSLGVSYIAGRLIYMTAVRRIGMVALAIGTFALLPVAVLPLLLWTLLDIPLPFVLALGVTIAYGVVSGIITVLRPALLLMLVGQQNYGRHMGLFSRPLNLVAAIAPISFGVLLNISAWAFLLAGVVLSVVAALMIVKMARSTSLPSASRS